MIKLHANPYSGNSRKVHWALEELGLAYEYVMVDLMTGAHKEPAFTALNPHGRVPLLNDDGFWLYESNAILLYLTAHYGKDKLGGRDDREDALINQWLFVQAFDIQPALQKAFVIKLYASLGAPLDQEGFDRAVAEAPAGLRVLDAHLQGKQYVVGEHFSIADVSLAEPVGLCQFSGIDLTPYPAVTAWFGRLSERPAFQKTRPQR
jgi:glutathione S-transferase